MTMLNSPPRPVSNESQTILVKVEYPFGRELIRPLCDIGKAFARIAGTETLTRNHIDIIKKSFGYTVEVVQDKVEL